MTVDLNWVQRVREVMAEARPRESLESSVMKAWDAYSHNAEQLSAPVLDQAPRAIKTRAILRIAQTYGWQAAIAHFLDMKGVPYLSDLTEPQLDDLHDRMLGYVDGAMTGCDSIDTLPAF